MRDSFTMPEADFSLIAALKATALAARRAAKKSELLRAGLRALALLDGKALAGPTLTWWAWLCAVSALKVLAWAASARWVVSHRWADWHTEVVWMSAYFSVAVWLSIGLVHLPSLLGAGAQQQFLPVTPGHPHTTAYSS